MDVIKCLLPRFFENMWTFCVHLPTLVDWLIMTCYTALTNSIHPYIFYPFLRLLRTLNHVLSTLFPITKLSIPIFRSFLPYFTAYTAIFIYICWLPQNVSFRHFERRITNLSEIELILYFIAPAVATAPSLLNIHSHGICYTKSTRFSCLPLYKIYSRCSF